MAEIKTAGKYVVPGDARFEEYVPHLLGKRVALFSNHTGIVAESMDVIRSGEGKPDLVPLGQNLRGETVRYKHILDELLDRGVKVTAIFSPEHGFRGTVDDGMSIADSKDEKTGIPVYSLYGTDVHAPSEDSLALFDTLVIDMQDVGLRYYTYYICMYYLMEACAGKNKRVWLLDRPNPNGFYTDGPMLRERFRSGVGMLPVPVVHGMTWGELAGMINGEGWLSTGKNSCDLNVVRCLRYTHDTKVRLSTYPSPGLKSMRAVYLYSSLCYFENTPVSVGRGTDHPFELFGSPLMSDTGKFTFSFIPRSMSGAGDPPMKEELCRGEDLREKELAGIWEEKINLRYLTDAYRDIHGAHPETPFFGMPDSKGRYWIDKLIGTDKVRTMIIDGAEPEEIRETWRCELEDFRRCREPYLLYERSALPF